MSLVNVSIPASLEDLKAKAPAFKEGSLTITFSAATLAKVNPGIGEVKTKEGEAAVANIHNAIEDGIKFFEADLA
jgi:hypothetical protein